jgi:hypothetical protein
MVEMSDSSRTDIKNRQTSSKIVKSHQT